MGIRDPRPDLRVIRRPVLATVAVLSAVAMVACSHAQPSTSASQNSTNLTVWVDAVRLPVAKAYAKAHPELHVDIVTYDGDGNGATSLQAKVQLWNRTGSGWPDVVFSEQANDPVWMAQKPFEFAAPVKGLISDDVLSKWPAPSTAQCTVDCTQVCVQDNLAQVVLWVNKKLMGQFNYTVPTTFHTFATTVFNPTGTDARAGYPAYGPLAEARLSAQASNPYFAADPTPALKAAASQIWSGWNLVTYPDQPVWSNTVVTQLVAGKSLSSQMQALGDTLAQTAKASGYEVVRQ